MCRGVCARNPQRAIFALAGRFCQPEAAGPDLADGKWHTISCHKGASSISVTIDGTTFSQPVKLGSLNTGGLAWVGVGSNGTDYYNGQLDNLIVTIG